MKEMSKIIKTKHGLIRLPCFMPIATAGAIKNVLPQEFATEIILANTYHLYLRPGLKTIARAGGLHKFMNWPKAILTDSGGYQIFSLAKFRKISKKGVEFRSHLDGSKHLLTPEKAIKIQETLDSDIMMVLDVCAPYPCSYAEAKRTVELTTGWAKRGKRAKKSKNLLFGIIQGSVYSDLRLRSLNEILALDFDGYAIGGLAVGEPREEMFRILDLIIPQLPQNKPIYLMGVGQPAEIKKAIKKGIDMFDCVLPTRNARHGDLYTKKGILHITNQRYAADNKVITKDCQCFTCRSGYSRAYLHHLYKLKEPLYLRLATYHNLHFYLQLFNENNEKLLPQNESTESSLPHTQLLACG